MFCCVAWLLPRNIEAGGTEDLKLVSPQGPSPITAALEAKRAALKQKDEVLVRMEAMQKEIQGLKDKVQGHTEEIQAKSKKNDEVLVRMEAMQKEIQAMIPHRKRLELIARRWNLSFSLRV